MAYDPTNDVLYVTGQVGPNGCFVGVLKLSAGRWISKHVLPEPAVGVTLGILRDDTSKQATALILATTEEGGLLTDTREPGSTKSIQYGLLVPLAFSPDGQTSTITGDGVLFHEDVVQYPRALVQDPLHTNYIYVASMHSFGRPKYEFGTQRNPLGDELDAGGIVEIWIGVYTHGETTAILGFI
jgi:hypothetical protein